ncbi:MAG: hypothetical protein RIR97_306 [Pseudomonadota bacterium]|jgi:uncharacterized membrane protein YedE/YeeE
MLKRGVKQNATHPAMERCSGRLFRMQREASRNDVVGCVPPDGNKEILNEMEQGMITEFTPFTSLFGGMLIGLAAVLLMALNGRIAGMTAMFGGILDPLGSDSAWRLAFLTGAIIAPMIAVAAGFSFGFESPTTGPVLVLGGIIVGIGVTYGSGCTSGHGVCGLARLSPRSLAATLTFMATTFATVTLIRHGIGV